MDFIIIIIIKEIKSFMNISEKISTAICKLSKQVHFIWLKKVMKQLNAFYLYPKIEEIFR